ncbi:hypothetical protein GMORB2_4778 [Geosmithia morbida]|uniref:Uncharacterized protein n=1 Tax=Geosmithia morbida TaxID=1094350 RepID=A0A9P4YP71_9HYPO|nr:uncharacterized protein GMORB2_4778 [Geosmithia morbida]KAF4119259.1 hypothetical protein GMORB2_4778 [Geosmithia morbida]
MAARLGSMSTKLGILGWRDTRPLDAMGMPTEAHESFHNLIHAAIDREMIRMNVDESWHTQEAATHRAPSGVAKEGDYTGAAILAGGKLRRWPTLAIEVGRSQSLESLRTVMRLWFHESEHAVKIVILVKLYRNNRSILVEKYAEGPVAVQRPGATTTRFAQGDLAPILRQAITIREATGCPLEYKVSGAPLVLEFNLRFLRLPDLAAGEGDIIIDEQSLQRAAALTWAEYEDE